MKSREASAVKDVVVVLGFVHSNHAPDRDFDCMRQRFQVAEFLGYDHLSFRGEVGVPAEQQESASAFAVEALDPVVQIFERQLDSSFPIKVGPSPARLRVSNVPEEMVQLAPPT